MDLTEARALVSSSYWGKVRDAFLATGTFEVYPKDDPRRFAYLDESVQREIALWLDALEKVDAWRTVVDSATVRRLKADYPGVYPDIFRYAAYFAGKKDVRRQLLKLRFPEAYDLCYS